MKGSLDTSAQEGIRHLCYHRVVNYSFKQINTLATPHLPEPRWWFLIVKICPYRGKKDGDYSASEPPSYIWEISHHMSIDERHTFQHRDKNGWTFTLPDSLEAKAWDLVLAQPASKAGDRGRRNLLWVRAMATTSSAQRQQRLRWQSW